MMQVEVQVEIEGAKAGTRTPIAGTAEGYPIVKIAPQAAGPMVLDDSEAAQLDGGARRRVGWWRNPGITLGAVIAYVRYESGAVPWSPANLLAWYLWAESNAGDRVLLAEGTVKGNVQGFSKTEGGAVVAGVGAAETLVLEVQEQGAPLAAGRAGGRLVGERRP